MARLETWLAQASDLVWGPPLLILLFGTHVYLTLRLRFVQRYLWRGIRLSFSREQEGDGDISHFGALTTALAATIGTGNIVGVATAVAAGGPGGVLWIWHSRASSAWPPSTPKPSWPSGIASRCPTGRWPAGRCTCWNTAWGCARTILIVALVSGGIGGLAGASEVAGIHFHLIDAISPGYGYTGIIIATLGSLNAIGVAAATLFIGLVGTGSQTVSRALGVPAYLGDVLLATLLLVTLAMLLLQNYRISLHRRSAAPQDQAHG